MEMTIRGGEGESLLRERNGAQIKPYGFTYEPPNEGEPSERAPFLHKPPVKLTPAWEATDLPADTLNLKGVGMELAPPKDRGYLIYLTMILHGLGTLTAWNMVITARPYFVDHKLGGTTFYASHYLSFAALFSQVPNLIFSWLNVFVNIGGDLTVRIVWSLCAEVLIFVLMVALAMVDSSQWIAEFFWISMAANAVLNSFNSIFQNSVYGVAGRLPPQYVGAVVLGSNFSGTLTTIIEWTTTNVGSVRTAAIYYFIGGMLILLACFDTYFALPLNRFYRYHQALAARTGHAASAPPLGHWRVFRACWLQLFNVFLTFFVTLTVFPSVQASIKASSADFLGGMTDDNYRRLTCFLTFNLTALIGNMTASIFTWPGPRLLTVLTMLRLAFIPLFLLCNYLPEADTARTLPVLIDNDWAYWAIGVLLGWSSGHCSSLAMMYVGRPVPPEGQAKAGMMGAACLVTGLVAGIAFSMVVQPAVYWQVWKHVF